MHHYNIHHDLFSFMKLSMSSISVVTCNSKQQSCCCCCQDWSFDHSSTQYKCMLSPLINEKMTKEIKENNKKWLKGKETGLFSFIIFFEQQSFHLWVISENVSFRKKIKRTLEVNITFMFAQRTLVFFFHMSHDRGCVGCMSLLQMSRYNISFLYESFPRLASECDWS